MTFKDKSFLTLQDLTSLDPKPVLDRLGVSYVAVSDLSYKMNLRNERTPSAFISLYKGKWHYKDFGSGDGGSVLDVIMSVTDMDFKEALSFACDTLGVVDRLKNEANKSYTDKMHAIRKLNARHEKQNQLPKSKITGVYDLETNEAAIGYLFQRGIVKIPKELKLIAGEFTSEDGSAKKVFGIGVMTATGGADIHFLRKLGNLKTLTLKNKDITASINNPNSNEAFIFESKFDYAAAFQQLDLRDKNIIIANSVSNAGKVVEFLRAQKIANACFFQQNDEAGLNFVRQVCAKVRFEKTSFIRYSKDESGKDINDLLLANVRLGSRIVSAPIHLSKARDDKSL